MQVKILFVVLLVYSNPNVVLTACGYFSCVSGWREKALCVCVLNDYFTTGFRYELRKACLTLFFVILIKVYSSNLQNGLRNKPPPVSLVHLCSGVLRNSQGKC